MRSFSLDPLPVGPTALAQRYNPHETELLPVLRRTSAFTGPPTGPNSAPPGATSSLSAPVSPFFGRVPTLVTPSPANECCLASPSRCTGAGANPVPGAAPPLAHGPGLQPYSKTKYMPRVIAYEPPSVQPQAPLPVLLYTEFIEL